MRTRTKVALALATAAGLGVGAVAVANGGRNSIRERLSGYEEVPAVSTTASGRFRAAIDRGADEITYRLTYTSPESPVTQAHIHFAQESVNGGIVVFLCSNLGNGPAGTQTCPAAGGTVEGTITPANVGAGRRRRASRPASSTSSSGPSMSGPRTSTCTRWPEGVERSAPSSATTTTTDRQLLTRSGHGSCHLSVQMVPRSGRAKLV